MASLLTSWSSPSLQPGARGRGQAVPRPGFPGRAVPALNTFVLGSHPSSLPCSPGAPVARQGVLSPCAFTLCFHLVSKPGTVLPGQEKPGASAALQVSCLGRKPGRQSLAPARSWWPLKTANMMPHTKMLFFSLFFFLFLNRKKTNQAVRM